MNFPEIKRKKLDERKEEDKKEFKDLFELDTDSDEENVGFPIKGTALGLGWAPCPALSVMWGSIADLGQEVFAVCCTEGGDAEIHLLLG